MDKEWKEEEKMIFFIRVDNVKRICWEGHGEIL